MCALVSSHLFFSLLQVKLQFTSLFSLYCYLSSRWGKKHLSFPPCVRSKLFESPHVQNCLGLGCTLDYSTFKITNFFIFYEFWSNYTYCFINVYEKFNFHFCKCSFFFPSCSWSFTIFYLTLVFRNAIKLLLDMIYLFPLLHIYWAFKMRTFIFKRFLRQGPAMAGLELTIHLPWPPKC